MTAYQRRFVLTMLVLVMMLTAACGFFGESEPEEGSAAQAESNANASGDQTTEGPSMKTDSGLEIIMLEEGDGPKPEPGRIVKVHYTGTLEDGTQFDSSVGGDPYTFPLGQGRVIRGWDEGIAMLNKGGKAKLIIPPDLGYGAQGSGGVIPPNATLHFEVELVDILPGAPAAPQEVADDDYVTTDSGLKYYDFEVGEGETPEAGQTVFVNYTGWLTDGVKFDSSLDSGQPLPFTLGRGEVIAGWDEGIASMKVGGKRQLVIPPELAYGEQGYGGLIPPDSTLIFEVELLGVR